MSRLIALLEAREAVLKEKADRLDREALHQTSHILAEAKRDAAEAVRFIADGVRISIEIAQSLPDAAKSGP